MRSRDLGAAVFVVGVSLAVAACAGSGSGGRWEPGGTGTAPGTGTSTGTGAGTGTGIGTGTGTGATGSGDTGTAGSTGAAGTSGSTPQSGLLTAGTWDDNLNFGFYRDYLRQAALTQVNGLPQIPRENRLEVEVTDAAGAPLSGAMVTVTDAAGIKLLEAPTRSDGRLFFLPGTVGSELGTHVQIAASLGAVTAATQAVVGDASALIQLPNVTAAPPAALDLALVIDTTGSMGDEIDYLKVEVRDIAARIADDFPNVAQRWALIVYRDVGDAYVVRSFDFGPSLTVFQTSLAAQSAGGGGDYPEAPDQALAKLTTLSWRQPQDSAARMAFWLADAPHHTGREGSIVNSVLLAQRLGIHIYPIAASGTDDVTEYSMRTAAQVTGGRYLFLTDDSGIGGAHMEPTIPCYFVTALNRAMIRMAAMELSGTNVNVAPGDIIRTGGNPRDGRCSLANGSELFAL
jgi:hypothetical protein